MGGEDGLHAEAMTLALQLGFPLKCHLPRCHRMADLVLALQNGTHPPGDDWKITASDIVPKIVHAVYHPHEHDIFLTDNALLCEALEVCEPNDLEAQEMCSSIDLVKDADAVYIFGRSYMGEMRVCGPPGWIVKMAQHYQLPVYFFDEDHGWQFYDYTLQCFK